MRTTAVPIWIPSVGGTNESYPTSKTAEIHSFLSLSWRSREK